MISYSRLHLLQGIAASEMEIKRLAPSQSADLNFRLPEAQEYSVLIQPPVIQSSSACWFAFRNLLLR